MLQRYIAVLYHRLGIHFLGQICKRMEKLLGRASAMGDKICDCNDDMGQSMLVQQEQNIIWREEQQIFNATEETVSGGKSVEESNDLRMTSWRCRYSNEEENSEDNTINNNSDMAG